MNEDVRALAAFVAHAREDQTFPHDEIEARAVLYSWYLNPAPLPPRTGPPEPYDLSLPSVLDAAVSRRANLVGGWRVEAASTWGRVTAVSGNHTRVLNRTEYRVPGRPGLRAEPGDPLLVRSLWTWVDDETGFWMCRRGHWPPLEASFLSRIYWNAAPENAPTVVGALAERLQTAGLESFMLKTPSSPDHIGRADALVLYMDPSALDRVWPELEEVVAVPLRPNTPRFTKRLARGVGYAEGPLSGDSFGEMCADLIASVLFGSEPARGEADATRLALLVEQGLGEQGIDPDLLHRREFQP